jgi:hypothetical protein
LVPSPNVQWYIPQLLPGGVNVAVNVAVAEFCAESAHPLT